MSLIALWFMALGSAIAGVDAISPGNSPLALQTTTYHGQRYIVCESNPKRDDIQLFIKRSPGIFVHDFTGLETYVAGKGEKLLFAANAGMFEPDSLPVGLLVQNGNEISPLNLRDGQGNFYMKPNGIFLINQKREAKVIESGEYSVLLTPALWATQSGPLLVHGGDIHPEFIADSKNLKIRSGVGVRNDGIVEFALSAEPVNFYDFALFYRTRLRCPNALYLDGEISAFYAPGVKDTAVHRFGPIIGIVESAAGP